MSVSIAVDNGRQFVQRQSHGMAFAMDSRTGLSDGMAQRHRLPVAIFFGSSVTIQDSSFRNWHHDQAVRPSGAGFQTHAGPLVFPLEGLEALERRVGALERPSHHRHMAGLLHQIGQWCQQKAVFVEYDTPAMSQQGFNLVAQ
ncbi:hypothetical protein SDC9_207691 [bioreactor metagenome]|uniref:Uncharacterized protein n=1 Tax=bioreactor metagenome TaxID=1076179 RepID=A0A645J8G3_9ZZZZ